ncbi:hypothetical protein [Psychrobacter sp. 16-MNA-CIBAN-0192]|uniref:hypothetical protein n=1 Tax=Psychrobacter sp. 16-MNA-CIBAN-0192 TaxID=3140448 RepID=UPI0033194D93
MFAVITILIIVWIVMWGFYKVMYPRPPKSMMPQKGDITTPRQCNFCGHSLAEYRGVLEPQSVPLKSESISNDSNDTTYTEGDLFFCNYEHQADFHAGKKHATKQDNV